jgi:hypothetical protein
MGELYDCDKGSITAHARKIGYDYSKNKEIKITNIPIEQVIFQYETLGSCQKVGDYYGCSSTAVANYLRKNNYTIKNRNNKLDNIDDKEFIKLYDELKSADKLGEIYHCSGTSILNYAKKIGYDPNSNKIYKLSEEDKQKIIEQYYNKTSNELAQEFNVTRGMITKVWYDANLTGKEVINKKTSEIDLANKKFGLWSVLYKTNKRDKGGNIYWHCKCECGIERDVLSTSLRNGTSLSCGAHKNISKGNEKIKEILTEANISFEAEKKFNTCKDKKELPFDFYVNNEYLIEYDGQ